MKITFDQDLLQKRQNRKAHEEVEEAVSRKGLGLSTKLDTLDLVYTPSGNGVCRLVAWLPTVVLEVHKPNEFANVMLLVEELEASGKSVELRLGFTLADLPEEACWSESLRLARAALLEVRDEIASVLKDAHARIDEEGLRVKPEDMNRRVTI